MVGALPEQLPSQHLNATGDHDEEYQVLLPGHETSANLEDV